MFGLFMAWIVFKLIVAACVAITIGAIVYTSKYDDMKDRKVDNIK